MKSEKSMKIVNVEEEIIYIFWKVPTLSLKNIFLKNSQNRSEGVELTPCPSYFVLKHQL